MNECLIIKELTQRLIDGEDADDVIPFDSVNLTPNCFKELLLLYIKYGKNEQRIHACEEKYKELFDYEAR